MSVPKMPKLISAAAVTIIACVVVIGVEGLNAGATGGATTFYACLKAGALTSVGRTAPTCKAPATQISWNQTGPAGPAGNTVLSGTGAPVSTIGNAGDFYLETSNDTIYGPATHTCTPLPCHTIWGNGTSLKAPGGLGAAYEVSGVVQLNTAQAMVATLRLPDGYYSLQATVSGHPAEEILGSRDTQYGLDCKLFVNYDGSQGGLLDERTTLMPSENESVDGDLELTGLVHYDPTVGSKGYAVVACSSTDAYTEARIVATQVGSMSDQTQ